MNIFELLKHEKHHLEVIREKESNEVFLGCMDCGKVLASSTSMYSFEKDLIKFKSILIERNCNNLLTAISKFDEELVNLIVNLAKDYIEENIVEHIDRKSDDLEDEYGVEINLYSFLLRGDGVNNGILYDFESEYLDGLFYKNFDLIKEELLDFAYKEMSQYNFFKVLRKGETYVVSNHVLTCDRSDYLVLDTKFIDESETQEPTVTNILKFDDEKDFAMYITEKSNKKEFNYRVYAGLIDVSNLRKDLIVEALELRIDSSIVNLLDLLINRN